MKKIKKKKTSSSLLPAFLVGWTHGDAPPPGFLSAWFDHEYGGPLHIRFLSSTQSHDFEAIHTTWLGIVRTGPLTGSIESLCSQLQWEHSQVLQIFTRNQGPRDRQNGVLHLARLARGLTMLTDGTTYDLDAGIYINPSDWQDRDLREFQARDHVQIGQRESMEKNQLWVYTRGLQKFGLDDLEVYLPLGLPTGTAEEILSSLASQQIETGKNPKIGEKMFMEENEAYVEVIRHRTDPIFGAPLAFREIRVL